MKRILFNTESNGGGGTATINPSRPTSGGTIKQVRVDVAKPPPSEVLKGEFDMSGMDDVPLTTPVTTENTKTGEVKEVTQTPAPIKQEAEVKKPEEKKEPEKKEEKVEQRPSILKPPTEKKAEGEKKEGQVKPVQVQVPQGQRDYTGYTPEEQTALKQMSNEGFALTTNLIKQNRELKKQEGSLYFQHDQAFVLDPEYQGAVQSVREASYEGNHWLRQLEAAEAGKDIQDFRGWDKDGKPLVSSPFKPSASIVEQMRSNYQNCVNATRMHNQKMQEIPKKYSEQIKRDISAFDVTNKQMFEWEQKPELLDYTIPVEFEDGVRERSIKEIREDIINQMPVYMRSHPLARVVGNMTVAIRFGQAMLAQANGAAKVEEIKAKEKSRGEPTSEVRPIKPEQKKVHGVTEFSALDL